MIILMAVLYQSESVAATISATSCSRADVGAAVTKALDGDTVLVPAGTCAWTSTLDSECKYAGYDRTLCVAGSSTTGKQISLIGAGVDKTIIIDNVSKAVYPNIPFLIRWQTAKGRVSRISGFTFKGGGVADPYNMGMILVHGNSDQFIFDNNKVITNGTSGLIFKGDVRGVTHHNTFDISSLEGFAIYTFHDSWNGVGAYGDNSWAQPDNFGTVSALYFEDNIFTNDQSRGYQYYAVDGWMGGRVVYRNNTFNNCTAGNHGTESGGRQRSQRQFEYYNNTFNFNLRGNSFSSLIGSRGGVGVVYNNKANITNGSINTIFDLQYYRASAPYFPWGKCVDVWDLAADRCMDQPGLGHGRLIASDNPTPVGFPNVNSSGAPNVNPNYAWGNTVNGVISNAISNVPNVVKAGRDFYNGVQRPGYVAYTYPHPLISGQVTPPPPPPPPSDTTAPSVTITSAPAAIINVTSASFSFSASDNAGGSGINRIECSLDGAAFSVCTSPKSYSGLAVKVHNFQVRAIDNAGNISTVQSKQFEVKSATTDTIAPIIVITGGANNGTVITTSDVSIIFSATDNAGGSGIKKVECALDSGAYGSCKSNSWAYFGGITVGTHTAKIRATDNAGNAAIKTISFSRR